MKGAVSFSSIGNDNPNLNKCRALERRGENKMNKQAQLSIDKWVKNK
jgi:hypothetical protein